MAVVLTWGFLAPSPRPSLAENAADCPDGEGGGGTLLVFIVGRGRDTTKHLVMPGHSFLGPRRHLAKAENLGRLAQCQVDRKGCAHRSQGWDLCAA